MAARYAAADYAAQAKATYPRGRVWSFDADSPVQNAAVDGFGPTFERSDASATALLDGSLPGANPDLLVEWEESLGLPDPCAGPSPTMQQRADQVLARFIGGGGQNRQRFIDYAATLGFTIGIVNYAPYRAGHSKCGDPCASEAWTFVWGVAIIANMGGLSPEVLRCELEAIKPAETTIIFSGADFSTEDGADTFVTEDGADTPILER